MRALFTEPSVLVLTITEKPFKPVACLASHVVCTWELPGGGPIAGTMPAAAKTKALDSKGPRSNGSGSGKARGGRFGDSWVPSGLKT